MKWAIIALLVAVLSVTVSVPTASAAISDEEMRYQHAKTQYFQKKARRYSNRFSNYLSRHRERTAAHRRSDGTFTAAERSAYQFRISVLKRAWRTLRRKFQRATSEHRTRWLMAEYINKNQLIITYCHMTDEAGPTWEKRMQGVHWFLEGDHHRYLHGSRDIFPAFSYWTRYGKKIHVDESSSMGQPVLGPFTGEEVLANDCVDPAL